MTAPQEPKWIDAKAILSLHDMQLRAYGGLAGVRDVNLLESAVAKPRQAWHYAEPQPDLFDMAALYTTGIARNHPFNDANKRTSWVTGQAFLFRNGVEPVFDPADALVLMVRVATGEVDEVALAAWLRARKG